MLAQRLTQWNSIESELNNIWRLFDILVTSCQYASENTRHQLDVGFTVGPGFNIHVIDGE